MNIRCPECGFERLVEETQLPPSATIATCPKCRHRFAFREVARATTNEQTGSTSYDVTRQPTQQTQISPNSVPTHSNVDTSSNSVSPTPEYDDPLPPGAVIPGHSVRPDNDTTEQPPSTAKDSTPASSSKTEQDDVWNAVSSVGDRWKKLYDARIKNNLESSSVLQQEKASANGSEIPWERLDKYGFFPGLYQTITKVLFAAPHFFAEMCPAAPLTRPLAFFVLLGVFQALMERCWYLLIFHFLGSTTGDPQIQTFLGGIAHEISLPVALLLSPFMLTLQILAFSGLYHMMLRLVQPDRADFPTMFRVVAYASAPTIACIVPLLGPLVGSLLFLVWTFIGTKFAFKLPWGRVILALLPLYILGFALFLQLVQVVMNSTSLG